MAPRAMIIRNDSDLRRTYATLKRVPPYKSKKPKTQKKLINKIAKQVINKNIETKMAMYYSSGQDFGADTGLLADAVRAPQNQNIATNTTDIKRLIPFLVPGTSDCQRIGYEVRPMSLKVMGNVQISFDPNLTGLIPTEIYVVIYVVQHVNLRSYNALVGGNLFNQFLKTGQNAFRQFSGTYVDACLPVADQYYKVLKKKVIKLRYAGNDGGASGSFSVANSHDYRANYQFTLTQKQLPAKFKYPEIGIATPPSPAIPDPNSPLNSSIFMCMGYYEYNGFINTTAVSKLNQQYVTKLKYKDA